MYYKIVNKYVPHEHANNIIINRLVFSTNKIHIMLFTRTLYLDFKMTYMKAVKEKKQQFVFNGSQFLTAYAKLMLDYLGPKFEK